MAVAYPAHAKVLLLLLLPLRCYADSDACADDHTCQAHIKSLMDELGTVSVEMRGKRKTLESLERLRRSVSSGGRVELPPSQHEALVRANPLISDVTFDTKHRPVSTNRTRHVHRSKRLVNTSQVILHGLMPIKPKTMSVKSAPFTLLTSISVDGKLSIHAVTTGDLLVDSLSLGHASDVRIRHLALSRSDKWHYIVTADDRGEMRVHDIKVVAKKAATSRWTTPPLTPPITPPKPRVTTSEAGDIVDGWWVGGEADKEGNLTDVEKQMEPGTPDEGGNMLETETATQEQAQVELTTRMSDKQVRVIVNFTCSFRIPTKVQQRLHAGGDMLQITALTSVERDDATYFVAGDSLGGITVFHADGKMKGRMKVTGNTGGILGVLRGQGQQLVFFSSHSFGFFSVSQVDMPFAPCTGWTSPLVDMVLDRNYGCSRAYLALANGDVVAFSTKKEKVRVCELVHKFPRVSRLPFKLQMWKYHVVGMQMPRQEVEKSTTVDPLRELFFFNTLAMDAVHSDAASRIVTAQLNFRPFRLDDFDINPIPGMAAGDRSRAQLALRFAGEPGVEVSEVTLKQPTPPKGAFAGAGTGEASDWFSRFPKVAVFSVIVTCVILWNLRKARFRSNAKEIDDSGLEFESSSKDSGDSKVDSKEHAEEEDDQCEEDHPKIEEVFD